MSESQQRSLALSPVFSLCCGYVFTLVVMLVMYFLDFYENSDYFQWGPPVIFFSSSIENKRTFYVIFVIVFLQQIMTNWIYEVIMPWIINTIQNPRHNNLDYSKKICIFIINANSLFSQLHLAFIISSVSSQISFLFCLILADILTLTYINWNYIKNKNEPSHEPVNTNIELQISQTIESIV